MENLLLKELGPGSSNASGHNVSPQGAQPICREDIQIPIIINFINIIIILLPLLLRQGLT